MKKLFIVLFLFLCSCSYDSSTNQFSKNQRFIYLYDQVTPNVSIILDTETNQKYLIVHGGYGTSGVTLLY